jgi:tetratricopeptide (TPR) repeat protein
MYRSRFLISLSGTAAYTITALICPALAQNSPTDIATIPAVTTKVPESAADAETSQTEEPTTEDTRATAIQAMDQMIEISKGLGDAENAASMQAYRDKFPGDDEVACTSCVAHNLYDVIDHLEENSQLRLADQLIPILVRLTSALRKEQPSLFMAAHYEAGQLDKDFERYESALKHISIALKCVEEDGLNRHNLIVCKADYAYVLSKLKRYSEAENIYKNLIQQCKENSEGLSDDDLYELQFSLAILYGHKGAYQECRDAMPEDNRTNVDKNSRRESDRSFVIKMILANYYLSEEKNLISASDLDEELIEKNLNGASDLGEELIESSQETYGVSSCEHIQAIELLATVRVEQGKYDDAVQLLTKSAKLRSGLFGNDHPSIARVNTELDTARKKLRESPIWKPIISDSETETDARYGEVNPLQKTAR